MTNISSRLSCKQWHFKFILCEQQINHAHLLIHQRPHLRFWYGNTQAYWFWTKTNSPLAFYQCSFLLQFIREFHKAIASAKETYIREWAVQETVGKIKCHVKVKFRHKFVQILELAIASSLLNLTDWKVGKFVILLLNSQEDQDKKIRTASCSKMH